MKRSDHLKNVLIYCRESRDDGFINYERIETQRDILVEYCKSKNLGKIIDIILDDNKSGTDFERLEPIKERIRNNEVDILLLKDASRLGRNILESLTFTAFLDKYKVELIFESEQYDEDMFPLIAWFNERRAKDDSIKIRRVLKHKMEGGEIIIKAPYGYTKQGNQLIINEEAATVVREVFDLYLKGYGKYEIATIMNHKGYPTPSQLKEQYENTKRTHIWNKQHIERILNHIIYTGDMPYGMRRKVSFKSKKYVNVDKNEWIIIPDHHMGIISKEMFMEAQAQMKKSKRTRARKPSDNLFSGLMFCGRCGCRMYRKTQNGKNPWYSCSKSDQEGTVKDHIRPNYGCYSHRIRESVLVEIMNDYICQLISAPEFEDDIRRVMDNQESYQDKTVKEIRVIKERVEILKSKASKVYDDKLDDRLPEFLFKEKIDEITSELNSVTFNLHDLEKSLKEMQEDEECIDKYLDLVEQTQKNDVNHQTLSLLFKKIIVFNDGDIVPEVKERYFISDEEYNDLYESGGVLFIQNFMYKMVVYHH